MTASSASPAVCYPVDGWLRIPLDSVPISRREQLMRRLTLQGTASRGVAPILPLYKQVGGELLIPRCTGFVEEEVYLSHVREDTVWSNPRRFPKFAATLRDYQETAVGSFMKSLGSRGRSRYGGLIEAAAGSGKTVMGIAIMERLARSTLVLCHKTFLVNQWRDRLKSLLPGIRVGVVQQDVCQFGEEYDVVIALLQSLASRRYPEAFYRAFDIVVTDEVHRTGAETWHSVVGDFPARVRIGLTATPHRADGLEAAFYWHTGERLAVVDRSATSVMPPVVKTVNIVLPEALSYGRFLNYNGTLNTSRWVTELSRYEPRNDRIANIIANAVERGRKVILLSERREHLETLKGLLSSRGCSSVDYYVGGRSEAELGIAEKASVLLATYQMAQEGLDVPSLDVLVLATPRKDVEQAVGRIQRPVPGKRDPIVIDVVDYAPGGPGNFAFGLFTARRRVYDKLGARYLLDKNTN